MVKFLRSRGWQQGRWHNVYWEEGSSFFFFSGEAFGCWAPGRRYVRSFRTLPMCSQAFSWFSFNPWLAAVKKLYYHSLFIFWRYYTLSGSKIKRQKRIYSWPWATEVWTAQIHLYVDFFSINAVNVFSLMIFLKTFIFSNLLCCKNTVYRVGQK